VALPTPDQSQIEQAVRGFLLTVLPAGVEVVRGQDNRVPEPPGTDFVVFWAIRRRRIETNIDSYLDAAGTGAINNAMLSVSFMTLGTILLDAPVLGAGVAVGTTIAAFGTGSGGVGSYTVTPGMQSVGQTLLAFGTMTALQPTEVAFQLDVHGPNSADNAETISTLWRDDYAVEQFAASGFDVTPFYADDPRQAPFLNDQQQIETRWVIDALVQANQNVTVPQQFAAAVSLGLIEVDTTYP
jgi:hypothetical protein